MGFQLNDTLAAWLDAHAEALDAETRGGEDLLQVLARAGLLRTGVPTECGGTGATPSAAIAVVAELAGHSLSAAFVYWAQRAVIECLLKSPERHPARALLPRLLDGTLAGAPGLSNAMRALTGFDRLQIHHTPDGLAGTVAWATNLHPEGVIVLVAADAAGGHPAVYAIPGAAQGVGMHPHADLAGLRGTRTGSVRLDRVPVTDDWLLARDATSFLPRLRPVFIALQCGWGLGLARACLRSARGAIGASPSILLPEIEQLERALEIYWSALAERIDGDAFSGRAADLFAARREMVDLAASASDLELQALGSRAYSRSTGQACMRRRREAAFLAVVTPSMVQLKTELARLREQAPAHAPAPAPVPSAPAPARATSPAPARSAAKSAARRSG